MAKVDFLLFINTGTPEIPVYTKVGGQRGGNLNLENDPLELTTKDSEGFNEYDYGLSDWSLEADGLYVDGESSHDAIIDAFLAKEKLLVRWARQDLSGRGFEGDAIITEYSIEAPYDDTSTYSISLQGSGAPSEIVVTP